MKRLGFLALLAFVVLSPAAKSADEIGKIPGITIPRSGGKFLGVQVADGHFKISFYNAKKKPEQGDLSRAVLWWPVHYQPNAERTELTDSGDAKSLTSEKVVRPPLFFILHISLFAADKTDPVETYVIDFKG